MDRIIAIGVAGLAGLFVLAVIVTGIVTAVRMAKFGMMGTIDVEEPFQGGETL